VIGEPVNNAAKLEKHTKEEKVAALCLDETYQQALMQGYRPSKDPEKRAGRLVEGVPTRLDLVVLD